MLMQIGQKPESDFSEPIGMLEDCHKRILHFMGVLAGLAVSGGPGPLTQSERDSLERALRYFREAAPRHNADEEESLFPELRRCADAHTGAALDAGTALAQMAALEADHRWVETQHAEIDAIGSGWLYNGTIREEDRVRLRAVLDPLLRFYKHHIAIEEEEVFPAARKMLSEANLQKVGQGMAARRGLAK